MIDVTDIFLVSFFFTYFFLSDQYHEVTKIFIFILFQQTSTSNWQTKNQLTMTIRL